MSKGNPKIVVRVGESLLQQLQSAAEAAGCTISELVRTACTWYLVDLMQKK